ncbi:MAG: hypothetical protein RLZZ198_149 [Bacteroidota bacterium]
MAFCVNAHGMDSLYVRKRITHAVLCSSAAGSLLALNQVWYAPYTTEKFHFFNDANQWMQMDKFGHVFTGYLLTNEVNRVHYWAAGKRQPWVGAVYALSFLSALELMDGFSTGWGFSGSDMLANGVGVGLAFSQDHFFNRKLIIPKFSFSRSAYAVFRPEILGNTYAEQLLKDYNGQTYWFSAPIATFLNLPKGFKWICISLGYGCDAKLVGSQNAWNGFNARRQIYLSLDIDCSSLAPRHPKLNKVLSHLNWIKIPFPSLEFSSDRTRFHWISF